MIEELTEDPRRKPKPEYFRKPQIWLVDKNGKHWYFGHAAVETESGSYKITVLCWHRRIMDGISPRYLAIYAHDCAAPEQCIPHFFIEWRSVSVTRAYWNCFHWVIDCTFNSENGQANP